MPKHTELECRVEEIAEGKYDQELDEAVNMDPEDLRETYYNREIKTE